MANLVMLIGGIGDQSLGGNYPCVMDKGLFEDPTVDVTDYIGTNGAHKLVLTSVDMGTPSGGQVYLHGNFSSLATLVGKTTGDIYAFVAAPSAEPEGYYKILSIDGTSGCYISETNLDGETIASDDTATAVIIGGAGTNLAVATDRMADIELNLGYNVDILTNKSETAADDMTMTLASTLVGKIRVVGTVYDSSTASNNFTSCDNDVSKFPVFAMGAYEFKATANACYHVDYINLKFTGSHNSGVIYWNKGIKSVFKSCYIVSTGTDGVYIAYASVINCVVSHSGTGSAISSNGTVSIINTLVYSPNATGTVVAAAKTGDCTFRNLIICGNSSLIGLACAAVGQWHVGNVVYNAKTGIYYTASAAISNQGWLHDNIAWGNNVEGSVGIALADTAYELTGYMHNNFVGNFETPYNGNQDKDIVVLVSNPFKNGSGNMNIASDFWLTDAAKLICKAKPIDFDLDGTDDNFQLAGAISEQVASSGGVSNLIDGGFIR